MSYDPLTDDDLHGVLIASRCELSKSALRHAVAKGRLRRVRRDAYVRVDLPQLPEAHPESIRGRLRVNSVAAVLTLGGVASHRSAASLAHLPLWSWRSELTCLTVPSGRDTAAPDVHVHRARVPSHHVIDGAISRLSVGRTVLDLAREHGVWDAVVAGDYALRQSLTTVDELRDLSRDCARFPGIRRARAVIDLLDPRMESPLESASRLVLRGLPFPLPQPQVNIFDLNGHFLGRVDNYWDELGVVGEVDGREKYEQDDDLWDEKVRQEQITDTGLQVVRWGMAEVRDPRRLRARLLTGMQRAAGRSGGRRWIAEPAYPQPLWASECR